MTSVPWVPGWIVEDISTPRHRLSGAVLPTGKVLPDDRSQLGAQVVAVEPPLPQHGGGVTNKVPADNAVKAMAWAARKTAGLYLSPSVSVFSRSLSTTRPTESGWGRWGE